MPKAAPELVDSRLQKAYKHPTRVHALSVLSDRTASPRELGAEIERDGNHVAYHLDVLLKLGLIELVRTEPVRGGRVVEHFYRATERPWVKGAQWKEIGGAEGNPGMTATIMGLISDDVARAMAAGTLDGDDNHISRTPLVLDAKGYEELTTLLDETLEEGVFAIRERVANRIGPDTETVQTVVNFVQFDLPDSPKP